MATPGELVKGVAEAFGMPVETVRPVDRELAVAGLRRTGGRGPSAVKINSQDAAALLTAMATPGTIKDTPDRVRSYFSLPNEPAGFPKNKLPPLPRLSELPEQHTFEQALVAILSDFASDLELKDYHKGRWLGSIRFSAPWRTATIEFNGEWDERTCFVYMWTGNSSPQDYETGWADFTTETRFTCQTLREIGALISGAESE